MINNSGLKYRLPPVICPPHPWYNLSTSLSALPILDKPSLPQNMNSLHLYWTSSTLDKPSFPAEINFINTYRPSSTTDKPCKPLLSPLYTPIGLPPPLVRPSYPPDMTSLHPYWTSATPNKPSLPPDMTSLHPYRPSTTPDGSHYAPQYGFLPCIIFA